MLPSYFDYIFCAPKTKSTSQARIKPKIFVNIRSPEPAPKIPARLTTPGLRLYFEISFSSFIYINFLLIYNSPLSADMNV